MNNFIEQDGINATNREKEATMGNLTLDGQNVCPNENANFFDDLLNKYNRYDKIWEEVNMPYGSTVVLYADMKDCEYYCDNLNEEDEILLKKYYLPKAQKIQKINQNRDKIFDTIMGYDELLRSYIMSDLLIGTEAFSNDEFCEWNNEYIHCDKQDVISRDTMLFVYDVKLFSGYEIIPERKTCFVFQEINEDGAYLTVFHQYDHDFEKLFYIDFNDIDSADDVLYSAIYKTLQSMLECIIITEL